MTCFVTVLECADRIDVDVPVGSIEDAQEAVQVGAARDHLPVEFAAHTLHQGGGGADDIGLRHAEPLDPVVEAFAQQQGLVLGALAILVTVGNRSGGAPRSR